MPRGYLLPDSVVTATRRQLGEHQADGAGKHCGGVCAALRQAVGHLLRNCSLGEATGLGAAQGRFNASALRATCTRTRKSKTGFLSGCVCSVQRLRCKQFTNAGTSKTLQRSPPLQVEPDGVGLSVG